MANAGEGLFDVSVKERVLAVCNDPAAFEQLVRQYSKAIKDFSDFTDMFDDDEVLEAFGQNVFMRVPDQLPATMLVCSCQLMAKLYEYHHPVEWLQIALAAIKRCLAQPSHAAPALQAFSIIASISGATYSEVINADKELQESLMRVAGNQMAGVFPKVTDEAVKSLAARFQGQVTEEQAVEAFHKMAQYLDQQQSAGRAVTKVAADIFWGASNALAEGETSKLRRVAIECGLVNHAISLGNQSKPCSPLDHESAAFLAALCSAPQVCGDVPRLQRFVCTQLLAPPRQAHRRFVGGLLSGQSNDWVPHYLTGLLGLLTWATGEEHNVLLKDLADHPEFLRVLRDLCAPPAGAGRGKAWPSGRHARGIAALILDRHFPSQAPENAAELAKSLQDDLTFERWMVEPDIQSTQAWP